MGARALRARNTRGAGLLAGLGAGGADLLRLTEEPDLKKYRRVTGLYHFAVLFPDRITPPQSTIGFNPLMHHSDGLLAIEIAKTEGISYRAATELIDHH